jgi:hypothetical protein
MCKCGSDRQATMSTCTLPELSGASYRNAMLQLHMILWSALWLRCTIQEAGWSVRVMY